ACRKGLAALTTGINRGGARCYIAPNFSRIASMKPLSIRSLCREPAWLELALAAGLCAGAAAGVTYRLDRTQAMPGETLGIEAVFFNDGDTAAHWLPPRQIVLQWRSAQGGIVRSLAYLEGDAAELAVPVNTFAKVAW